MGEHGRGLLVDGVETGEFDVGVSGIVEDFVGGGRVAAGHCGESVVVDDGGFVGGVELGGLRRWEMRRRGVVVLWLRTRVEGLGWNGTGLVALVRGRFRLVVVLVGWRLVVGGWIGVFGLAWRAPARRGTAGVEAGETGAAAFGAAAETAEEAQEEREDDEGGDDDADYGGPSVGEKVLEEDVWRERVGTVWGGRTCSSLLTCSCPS